MVGVADNDGETRGKGFLLTKDFLRTGSGRMQGKKMPKTEIKKRNRDIYKGDKETEGGVEDRDGGGGGR